LDTFHGYHSEWNLGSPGGWDYQRITQIIGKAVWEKLSALTPIPVTLDFDHPLLFPVRGFVQMLVTACRQRQGGREGFIAVVAEEETLADVTENQNLAHHLNAVDGITSALMAPQWIEFADGRACYKGDPIDLIFMDFNTDVLLALHRKHDLAPVLSAVGEHRVINPRGTEPINVKSMFEVITGPARDRFHAQIVQRTPWTRQFFPRRTEGPQGETIEDLIAWTRANWNRLVLKPERGYSGKGVRVGGVNTDGDEAIELALAEGQYILQERVPLDLWAEEIPQLEHGQVTMARVQTDFRCLLGPEGMFGFLCRYGGVPTNVGSGGGVQPMALLTSDMSVLEASARINDAIMQIDPGELQEIVAFQQQMALEHKFTYLLGPIKIALRPRLITPLQLDALTEYGRQLWADCLALEKMYLAGQLDEVINVEPDELEIARLQPWHGSPAIIASDGLFSFGAHPETP
jgi:hypothetical protein